MSPGSSVANSDTMAIVLATGKIMSLVLESCMISPSSRDWIRRPDAPGGKSSGVTTIGPTGPVPSKFLPSVHWLDLRWKSRSEPSLKAV